MNFPPFMYLEYRLSKVFYIELNNVSPERSKSENEEFEYIN